MLLLDAMKGEKIPRAPSVPKIWLDLAANILGREYLQFFSNPELAAKTVAEAAIFCECDGARVFLFPKKEVKIENGVYFHYQNGRRLGQIDIMGGWATLFDDPEDIDFSDPMKMICYSFFKSRVPIISSRKKIKRLNIPSLDEFHKLYDGIVDGVLDLMGEQCCPIGDCNSGTLPFCISMLGMEEALINLYSEPDFIMELMEIGTGMIINQAKFLLNKGIRVLRLNDSVANMKVISPAMWREFIKPWFTKFCSQVHSYCGDARIYCHICGDVKPIIQDLIETGLDCIAPLDPLGNLTVGEIRKLVGDDFMLMGGVNTLSFINKTPGEIQEEAEHCIGEGFTNNGHYAVGSGCVVPRSAKAEAIKALAKASRSMIACEKG
jgi:uroporphyrinogen-III decarboxylase